MDKLIHRHLDNRLDIQEEAAAKVEGILERIDLKSLMRNPEAELARVANEAMKTAHSYAQRAATEGVRFAGEVKKKDEADKKIFFQDTADPKANEGEL